MVHLGGLCGVVTGREYCSLSMVHLDWLCGLYAGVVYRKEAL